MKIQKILVTVLATTIAATAFAQGGTAVKETGKAVSESAQEAGDKAKAAVSKEPNKTVDKGKAQIHKAKAHVHRHKAKKGCGRRYSLMAGSLPSIRQSTPSGSDPLTRASEIACSGQLVSESPTISPVAMGWLQS